MLYYRARLGEGVTVLAVSVRWGGRGLSGLGVRPPSVACRVRVRYADREGRVRTHRGRLWLSASPNRRLVLAGCQYDGPDVLLTLRPEVRLPQAGAGRALTNRFRLPFVLQSWGVVAVREARCLLRVAARPDGDTVMVRGLLHLVLETGGARFPLRLPFCRTVAAPGAVAFRWAALGGVTGLHLRVHPGGRVEGEAVIALRCTGRPAEALGRRASGAETTEQAPAPAPAGLRRVRQLLGRIEAVRAEQAGEGYVLVHGTAALDLYWIDGDGRGRWSGRAVRFSSLLQLPGVMAADRLVAAAAVERLTHLSGPDGPRFDLLVGVRVTALRPVTTTSREGVRYRLEQVVGEAVDSLSIAAPFFGEPAPGNGLADGASTLPDRRLGPSPGGNPAPHPAEVDRRPLSLALSGPAEGWQELATVVTVPKATAEGRLGRWQVRATLGGAPLGGEAGALPLTAASGGSVPLESGRGLVVLPALTAVGPGGVEAEAIVDRGTPLPEQPQPQPEATVEGELDLPGEVRAILHLEAMAMGDGVVRVCALVAVRRPGHLRLVEGLLSAGGVSADLRPVRAAAHLVWSEDGPRLRVAVELAAGQV